MGLTHMRKPKNFVLEDRLERYAAAIERRPGELRGMWAEACFPSIGAAGSCRRFRGVALDLGCGKGSYLVGCAAAEPDVLHVGMDVEPVCIAYAAQAIVESGLPNAVVVPRGADALAELFAPGELARIDLNFPTPQPKRHHAAKRLTTVDRLLAYRPLIAAGGAVTLRTDSQPLRDYTLTQLEGAGYVVDWVSDDVRAEHPGLPETEYERRLASSGARVLGVRATPGPEPSPDAIARARAAEQSLVRYLPDDLEALGYVPLGMEAAVMNLVNRRRRERARKERG